MTILSVLASAALSAMLAVALYNLRTAPRLADYTMPRGRPRVSVLVPARNEEHNLWRSLPALLCSDWNDLEIIVLDDASTDATRRVAEAFAAAHPHRLRVLRGRQAPPGWLSKSWACQQLADHAGGEILVFCDADVSVSRNAVRRTVAAMEAERADVLTGLPRQQLDGVVPRAAVPIVMHLFIAGGLPLARVLRSRAPSLALGNGQWLACSRSAYRDLGGHAAVAADIAEDMGIARAAKRRRWRLLPVVATDDLTADMYADGAAVWSGFRKNLYAIAGGTPPAFALVFTAFVLTMLLPFAFPFIAGVPAALALLPLALLGGLRVAAARLFHHGAAPLLLHAPGAVAVACIAVASAIGSRRGTLSWKGRVIDTQLREGLQK